METSSQPSNTIFVADVPQNITERNFIPVFQAQEGFKNARLRKDRNNNLVGFADFEDAESASLAMETLQGYKWSPLDKGLSIHFSHNSANSHPRPRIEKPASSNPNSQRESNSHHQENGAPRVTQHPSLSFMPDLSSLQQLQTHPSQMSTLPNYSFPNVFPQLPADASSTVFVEGLPSDATEREVAHIFRPFPGYQSLRILTKESKQNPTRLYNLCFVEFDNKYQATFAMNHLQGYRFDKDDSKGLTMSYAKTERKTKSSSRPGDGRPKLNTQRNE